jgi:hypothetical protein
LGVVPARRGAECDMSPALVQESDLSVDIAGVTGAGSAARAESGRGSSRGGFEDGCGGSAEGQTWIGGLGSAFVCLEGGGGAVRAAACGLRHCWNGRRLDRSDFPCLSSAELPRPCDEGACPLWFCCTFPSTLPPLPAAVICMQPVLRHPQHMHPNFAVLEYCDKGSLQVR